MKKIISIILIATLTSVFLVGCSSTKQKVVTKVEHTTIQTYASNHKVIVKTFGTDSTENNDYNALDSKISNYLSRIKNINDFDIKITSGVYSDNDSYDTNGNGNVYSYNNYRYMTVILIKKN